MTPQTKRNCALALNFLIILMEINSLIMTYYDHGWDFSSITRRTATF